MPCTCDETEIPVTISLGGATLNDSESIQDLLKRADDSLYQAKDSGRNRLVISTESDSVTS
jgi:diguanylate cyclase (GGDEF)-like protein